MGKTTKPLRILVIGLPQSIEFDELRQMGHTIDMDSVLDPLVDYDLILGPRCWRMDDRLLRLKLLNLAVKEGRLARYPTSKKEEES